MTKIIFILLVSCILHPVFSQYTVTKVIGHVQNKMSGEVLKLGSRLNDNDVLLFSSINDMVRVIVAGKGIYIITPSPKANNQQNELVEILKSTLHIKSKEGYLSGRSMVLELIPKALEVASTLNTKNLIAKENKYLFDKNLYDISAGNKFFLQIEFPGSDPVIHQLKTNDDTLFIYPSDFKISEKDAANLTYKLGFFSKEKNNSISLVKIDPYFDVSDKMENLIKLIIVNNNIKDKEKIKEQCYTEIYISLGKPSELIFNKAFSKIFSYYKRKIKRYRKK